MDQARVVVIGGGITGCSVAYHLAEAGWTDVLLRREGPADCRLHLPGGRCRHRVQSVRDDDAVPQLQRGAVRAARRLRAFRQPAPGIESGPAARARADGQPSARDRPRCRGRVARGSPPTDARDQPRRAVRRGLPCPGWAPRSTRRDLRSRRCRSCARSPHPDGRPSHRLRAVGPSRGHAASSPTTARSTPSWSSTRPASGRRRSRRWSARSSRRPRSTTSTSRFGRCPAQSCPATCPASATRTTSSTARASTAACCSAATRRAPRRAGSTASRGITRRASLPPDYERFAPLMAGAVRRFPFLADAEVIRLVCHPDAMTPDANPLLGPLPGLHGFWVAAGLSLNGFGGGGGIGRAMAGWITAGRSGRGRRAVPRLAASPTPIATRPGRPPWPGRPTATTTACATRTTPTRPAARAACRRSTAGSRTPARSSWPRRAGSGRTSIDPASPGGGPGATSAPTAGRGRRGSSGSGEEHRAVRERVGIDRPQLVRQDRRRRSGCARRCSSASAPTTSTARSERDLRRNSSTRAAGSLADVTVTRLAADRRSGS